MSSIDQDLDPTEASFQIGAVRVEPALGRITKTDGRATDVSKH